MKLMFRFFRFYGFCFCLCLGFWFCYLESFASLASPSNLEDQEEYGDDWADEVDDLLRDLDWGDLDDMERMELFDLYLQSLSGPGLATASNASIANIETMLKDIHAQMVPETEEEIEEDAEEDIEEDISFYALTPDFSLDRNVIIYEGRWQNQDCRLVLPASTATTLYVAEDGSLYNVGTSNIVGKIFYGDFEPLVYNNQYVFTLTPSLNNNASTLYNNRYPSYCTRYYYSSGSLRSSTTYGLFKVIKVVRTPSDLPDSVNGIYLLILILIGGVQILCFWKKSQNS